MIFYKRLLRWGLEIFKVKGIGVLFLCGSFVSLFVNLELEERSERNCVFNSI